MKFLSKHAWAVLLFFPIFLLSQFQLLSAWEGPRYFDPSSDPQYPYLLNSLAIAVGSYPGHMDHPGTTVQLLGGAVLRASHPGLRSEEIAEAVLKDPEAAAQSIAFVLMAFSAGLVFLSGIVVLRSSPLGLAGAFLYQLWPFLFVTTWAYSPRLAPDLFVTCLCQIFIAMVLSWQPTRRFGLGLGVILGLIMATKITALLFSGVPAILFGRRLRLTAEAYAVAFATFSAILLLAYRTKVKYFTAYFLQWIWGLAAHKGWYGEGAVGLPSVSLMGENVGHLASDLPLYFLIALLSLIFFRFLLWKHRENPGAWLVCAGITLVQVLLVSKASEARYAMPAFPASAGAVLLLTDALFSGKWQKKALRGLLTVAVLLSLWSQWKNAERSEEFQESVKQVEKAIPPGASKVCSGIGSGVDCALHFGSNFSHGHFSEALQRLYPDHRQWTGDSAGVLLNMKNEPEALKSRLEKAGTLYFHGRSREAERSLGISGVNASLLSGPKHSNSVWKVTP